LTFDPESFDAVLFHDALHHVIDEHRTFETCFRVLKPSGVLGISEDAWRPGDREQESALEEEIARFGTLESPFTQDYLDELLEKYGFRDVLRFHAINGLFPEDMGHTTIAEAAQSRAGNSNNLVARKSTFDGPTTMDANVLTRANIEVVSTKFHADDRKLELGVRLTNTGDTAWLHRHRQHGWVSIALRSDPIDGPEYREARPRHSLPNEVLSGDSLTLELEFFVDAGFESAVWRLDLVNEGLFWFSQRDTQAAPVDFF
jgi:SAM-dependent methyltransferase